MAAQLGGRTEVESLLARVREVAHRYSQAALTAFVDEAPAPEIDHDLVAEVVAWRPRGRRRLGVAVAIVLVFSTSGVAASVTGDPLSPVSFFARHLSNLAHPEVVSSDSGRSHRLQQHVRAVETVAPTVTSQPTTPTATQPTPTSSSTPQPDNPSSGDAPVR